MRATLTMSIPAAPIHIRYQSTSSVDAALENIDDDDDEDPEPEEPYESS